MAVAMTADKQMLAENTKICDEAARELLNIMQELQQLKCLDTTWYSMSVCAGCIFSTLVAQWERRFDMTPDVFAALKTEMKSWTSIVHEISGLLGKLYPFVPDRCCVLIFFLQTLDLELRVKSKESWTRH